MRSVNAMIRKDKINKKGLCPVYIRIISRRKSAYIPTGIKTEPKQWNESKQRLKSSFPNSTAANCLIDSYFSKVNEVFYSMEKNNKNLSVQEIKNLVVNDNKELLLPFITEWVGKRKERNEIGQSTFVKYNGIIKKLKDTFGDRLTVQEFDIDFLERYDKALRQVFKNSTNTIASNFSFLRAVANELIKVDKMKLNDYPFRKWKLSFEDAKRKYLTPNQVKEVDQIILPPNSKIGLSRDIFIFCTQTGFRIGDALNLKLENFTGTHFVFRSQKTKTYTTLLCTEKAKTIITPFLKEKEQEDYIFDFLNPRLQKNEVTALRDQSSATALINKNLGIISERLGFDFKFSTHYARHSLATNALTNGVSLEEIKAILHHQDIKTTEIYAKATNGMKDNAMKKIVS